MITAINFFYFRNSSIMQIDSCCELFDNVVGCRVNVLEYPVPDTIIDQLIGMDFKTLFKSSFYIPDNPKFKEDLTVNQFVQCLNINQKEILYNHVIECTVKLLEDILSKN